MSTMKPPLERLHDWAGEKIGREIRIVTNGNSVTVSVIEHTQTREVDFKVIGFAINGTKTGLVRGLHAAASRVWGLAGLGRESKCSKSD